MLDLCRYRHSGPCENWYKFMHDKDLGKQCEMKRNVYTAQELRHKGNTTARVLHFVPVGIVDKLQAANRAILGTSSVGKRLCFKTTFELAGEWKGGFLFLFLLSSLGKVCMLYFIN